MCCAFSMGQGRGKGGDQAGAIAAGCGAITCMILFFVFGLPCLITGIVFIRIANAESNERLVGSTQNKIDSIYHNR